MIENANIPALLPPRVRRLVIAGVLALVVVAVGLMAWRGPAILLDLAAMAKFICF